MTATTTDRLDGLASATAIKGPCKAASTSNITLSGAQTIDGVSIAANDRVLVTGQSDGTENGVYVASSGAWRRSKDFSSNNDIRTGTQVRVNSGSNAGIWVLTTADPVVIDTSTITFAIDTSLSSGASMGAGINASTAKAPPVAADKFAIWDVAGAAFKHVTWSAMLTAIGTGLGAIINAITAKTTPVDADEIVIADSAATGASKAVTLVDLWANYLKAKADALYQPIDTILTTLSALADGSGTLTNNGSGSLSWVPGPTFLADQATTSGTTKDFTIPAGAKKVTVFFNGMSTNSTANPGIALGDGGGIEATGYTSTYGNLTHTDISVNVASETTFFGLFDSAAGGAYTGIVTLTKRAATNQWFLSGLLSEAAGPSVHPSAGSKTLSAELTTVRITADGDTFDAGSVSVSWE